MSALGKIKRTLRPVLVPFRSWFLTQTRCRLIADRSAFEALSRRNDIPGMKDIWTCKFLITDIDSPAPRLFFMNTKEFEHHYLYYKRVTGEELSEAEFDSISYYSNEGRKNLAGSIVAHDNYCDEQNRGGLYTIDYWPTDPVSFKYIKLTWDLITKGMPFADGRICYHLSSPTQMNQFESEQSLYEQSSIRRITTNQLFGNLSYIPLNLGDSYGILKILDADEVPSIEDIVIFRTLPNDLSHVRGIITDVSQTPLSHVNLKAKQNHIPNAYIKNASEQEEFLDLIGKPVRYTVTADGYHIEEVTLDALQNHLRQVAPASTRVPDIDFSATAIQELKDISKDRSTAFGSKAANMGEIHSLLAEQHVISGHAIPFHLYDSFMKENQFYSAVDEMVEDEQFSTDTQYRNQRLLEFQQRICTGSIPGWMREQFHTMQSSYPEGADLRLRSSSNSEDLENFNGAGLYSSRVHFHKDGPIEESIKKVWASLWTYRAFTEREFHKIDHSKIAMGILVHLDHKGEQHNGVAVTKNIFNSVHDGFYINVQTGQSLVTNPDEEALPDELVVSAVGANKEYEIQTVRHSNLVAPGQSVMSEIQVMELIEQSRRIHDHFKTRYQAENDPGFAMEIQFLPPAARLKTGLRNIAQVRSQFHRCFFLCKDKHAVVRTVLGMPKIQMIAAARFQQINERIQRIGIELHHWRIPRLAIQQIQNISHQRNVHPYPIRCLF